MLSMTHNVTNGHDVASVTLPMAHNVTDVRTHRANSSVTLPKTHNVTDARTHRANSSVTLPMTHNVTDGHDIASVTLHMTRSRSEPNPNIKGKRYVFF